MIAVHPESPALADAVGKLCKTVRTSENPPKRILPRCETRPHAVFGHCTIAVIMMSPSHPCHRFRHQAK